MALAAGPPRPSDVSETDLLDAAESAGEPAKASWPSRAGSRARAAVTVPRVLLMLIAAAAATCYAWSMDTAGLENFYTAGVHSMAGSWHAFFYDAFDPHATITLDKLPGAFWIQALSVRCFGYSVWAMVLPQVVESTLTVLVLYRAVRRTAGTAAALTAAAILAASPVTVSSTRGNLSEPLYLLCIVSAADATLRAVTTHRTRSWYAAAIWVAVAFQAKMTEAWLVLPILALTLIIAAPERRRRTARVAGLGTLLAVGLSLIWMLCFTFTPAADRPYADGSKNNSIFAQVFDYNGMLRFDSSPGASFPPLAKPSPEAVEVSTDNRLEGGLFSPGELTKPGWDRLFTGTLAPDCAWFLLPAIGGAIALLASRRRAGRGDPLRAATVLWSSWLLGYGAAFSVAHQIQGYYLATLIPAIAALAGSGTWVLWRAARRGSQRAAVTLGALITGQAVWAVWLLHGTYGLVSAVIFAVAIPATLLLWAAENARRRRGSARDMERGSEALRRALAGLAAAGVLVAPIAAITWLEVRAAGPFDVALSPTGTEARPAPATLAARLKVIGAYGGSIHPQYTAGEWAQFTADGAARQRELQSSDTYELVFSSAEASDIVAYGVANIVPIGGFSGDAPYPDVLQIRQLISAGKISVAILPDADVLTANDPRVRAVEELCVPEPDGGDPIVGDVVYACATGL